MLEFFRLTGIKVLLIEDDRNTREALHDILDEHEVDIRVASSGSEGLAAFADFAPHALLCDINMPIEDGYSVIKKIRILEGEQIPAAALTALASADDQKQSLKAGFQLHLSKPISERSVCDAVAMLARLGARAAVPTEPVSLRPH